MDTHFKPDIPVLRGESNFDRWDAILHRTLEALDLEQWIQAPMVMPIPFDPTRPTAEEKEDMKIFKRERGQVGLLLGNSLLDPSIDQMLISNGWDRMEKDPFTTYKLVKQCITRTTSESVIDFFQEYVTLNRKNFDSLPNYLRRLQMLKKRLTDMKEGLPESHKSHLWILLGGLRDTYPNEYRFWLRDMDDGKLKWDTMMQQLGAMANKEANHKSLVNIPKNNNNTTSNSNNSTSGNKSNNNKRGPVVQCSDCTDKHPEGWKHHSPCGKHVPDTKYCFWCDPNRAPDTWRHKKAALERLESRRGSTPTGVLNPNSSGILHPSNLLFENNFDNTNSCFVAVDLARLNIQQEPQDFHNGPWRS